MFFLRVMMICEKARKPKMIEEENWLIEGLDS